MDNLSVLFYRLAAKLRFHGERLRLLPYHYPKKIIQRKVDCHGISFIVGNITEANRVRYLDSEYLFISRLVQELHPDDIFYDVGACIGLYSLHAARHAKRVYAFEPDPGFRQHLEINIKDNQQTNIEILPYAVAEKTSETILYTDGTDGKSPSLRDTGFFSQVLIQTRALDDLVHQRTILPPSVVKLDIEGAEILALKGMKNIFQDCPPRTLFIEIHPQAIKAFGSSEEEVVWTIINDGYSIVSKISREGQNHYIFTKAT